jgi:prepilin-type N-terminal cleavage/methylation domain-containing protein
MVRAAPATSPSRRRAFTLVEVALSLLLLAIAMSSTVKVFGWVAAERRDSERRQWAIQEVANLMERLTALPWDGVTPGAAGRMPLSEEARGKLPGAELAVDVGKPDPARGEKKVAIRLRWKKRGGDWDAPVRLTSWVARKRKGDGR